MTIVHRYLERRRKKRIVADLTAVGRWKPWSDAAAESKCGRGTIIEESANQSYMEEGIRILELADQGCVK